MTTSRILSLVISLIYIGAAIYTAGVKAIVLPVYLLIPLAAIWYGEALGTYSSPMRATRPIRPVFQMLSLL
jgi:hypothetical protein